MSRPSIAEELELAPHPEGGWYRQTWRSGHEFTPAGYPGTRAAATAIYFLLHPGEVARWHQVRSDELWLWHSGGPMTLRMGGTGDRPSEFVSSMVLGADLAAGQRPQGLVPAGTWQSASPAGHDPALVTCIVAPGFEYEDWRLA